jgi:hypothetical protein
MMAKAQVVGRELLRHGIAGRADCRDPGAPHRLFDTVDAQMHGLKPRRERPRQCGLAAAGQAA